jgi:hypothetical protein
MSVVNCDRTAREKERRGDATHGEQERRKQDQQCGDEESSHFV